MIDQLLSCGRSGVDSAVKTSKKTSCFKDYSDSFTHAIEAKEHDYLYIKESQIPSAGNGLFTAIPIYKDEVISIFKGKILSDNAQRRILAVLRNRTFFSLCELNAGIDEALDKLNDRPMQGIGRSRRELFAEVDHPVLRPLPEQRFELREWRQATVNIDYHIAVQGNFYSVH